MSEVLRPLAQRALVHLATPLALLAFGSGCTAPEQKPEPWHTTYPEISTAPTPKNLCTDSNIEPTQFTQSPALTDDYDTIIIKGERSQFDPLTSEESLKILADIKSETGIAVTFPDKPSSSLEFSFGAITDKKEIRDAAVTTSLVSILDALRVYSPETIKALELSSFAFVDGIKSKPILKSVGIDVASGIYDTVTNSIYIDIASIGNDSDYFVNTAEVIVHEIAHAIDGKLLCGPDDVSFDEAITKLNTQPYLGHKKRKNKIDDKYRAPNSEREFASDYGITNVNEDRADIVEWTFMDRGLILPGDPDADSPLAKKQAELIRRLELLAPGTKDFILQKTPKLRNYSKNGGNYKGYMGVYNEMDLSMETKYFPGNLISAKEVILKLVKSKTPIEVLTNGFLEISQGPKLPPKIIKSPIVLRNPKGDIVGVSWAGTTSSSGVDGNIPMDFESHFFDRSWMAIKYEGAAPSFAEGPISVSHTSKKYDTATFYTTGFSVNGVGPELLYIDDERQELAKYSKTL